MLIKGLDLGKKGKLYLEFILAVALVAVIIYSYLALASVPTSTPVIISNNGTTVNGVQINATKEGDAA